MAIGTGTGIDASFGYMNETTYGTYSAPGFWNDFNSESLKLNQKWTDPQGLASGRLVPLINRIAQTTRMGSGSVGMDFSVKNMTNFMAMILGTGIPITLTGASKAAYQIGTPGSMTWQFAKPQRDGTVKPFTAKGVACTGFEIASSEGTLTTMNMDVVCQDIVTSTALVSPSYPTGNEIFNHTQLVVKVGGTASTTSGVVSVAGGTAVTSTVKGVSVKGTNPLSESYGTSTLMKQPLRNGMLDYSIGFDLEFTSQAEFYDVWRAASVVPVQLTYTTTSLAGTSSTPYTLDIIASACKITDDSVNVSGADILPEQPSFKVGSDGVNNPLQLTIVTA